MDFLLSQRADILATNKKGTTRKPIADAKMIHLTPDLPSDMTPFKGAIHS